MKEPSYAILGMGRFGRKLTTMLRSTGAQILIADKDEAIINRYAVYATYAVCIDLTNVNAIEDIGLDHIDIAVIDLSSNLEPAILTITIARELGVNKIIATANTDRSGEILKRVGADEVIIPEDEAAMRLAKRLISDDYIEFHDLGGELCIIKIHPKKEWVGRSLNTLRLPARENVTVIAIEENGKMHMDFTPDTIIKEDSSIAIALRKNDIYSFV